MANDGKREHLTLSNMKIEVQRRGKGSPLLVLYGEENLEQSSAVLDALAETNELIIPSPPGFGTSDRPDWVTQPDDAAYVILDLVDTLKLDKVPVIGFSYGGWVAAEVATKNDSFMSKLILVGPYGIKVGGPFDVDIQDFWIQRPEKIHAMTWHDESKDTRDYKTMSDDELTIIARNKESFARFCWEPYMHNPKLKHRLHRITTPTLVVWGENDGLATVDYGKAYASHIPNARFATIAKSGHYPHLEQPEQFLKQVREFLA
jgi:pimeloyl-ACP methyl ester carboxylesterase